MIGLLRRGDDGLTSRQRQRMSDRYERTLGATPDAATFARARARHLASLLTSPQQGPDAAGMVAAPTHGRLLEAAIPACSASGLDAASGVGPGGAGGACGRDAQASPAVHQLPCQVAHSHADRFERDACEAEHLTVMARLLRLAVA